MGFTDAGRIIQDITWNYGKHQIQSIIDTGQVRRMTPPRLQEAPLSEG